MPPRLDTKESVSPRFLYFTRLTTFVSGIEAARDNEALYRLRAYFDLKDAKFGRGAALECHVVVAAGGEVRLLREVCRDFNEVESKRPGHPRGKVLIPTVRVGVPAWLRDMARRNGHDVATTVTSMFVFAANAAAQSAAGVRIRAERNGLVAVFSVEMTRTAYFFKDREEVEIDGRKRRIFHVVRTHKRVGAGGAERAVRTHFRGMREFRWNGCDILISVPGLHHRDYLDLQTIGHVEESLNSTSGYLAAKAVGRKLDAYLRTGGARHG